MIQRICDICKVTVLSDGGLSGDPIVEHFRVGEYILSIKLRHAEVRGADKFEVDFCRRCLITILGGSIMDDLTKEEECTTPSPESS